MRILALLVLAILPLTLELPVSAEATHLDGVYVIDLSTLVLLPGDNTPVAVWVVESVDTLTAAVLELDRATDVSRWTFVIGTLNRITGQGSGDVFDDEGVIDDTVNYTFTSTGFSFTTATGNSGTATRLFP